MAPYVALTRTRKDGSATCYFEDHVSIPCRGKLAFIVHDKRGCKLVCQAHAKWLDEDTSYIAGHGGGCTDFFNAGYKWQRVTIV